MHLLRLLPLIILLTAGGCTPEASDPARSGVPVVSAQPDDPFAGYPDADDPRAGAAIPPAISPDAAAIDERLGQMQMRTVTLDPEQSGSEPRTVRGWFDQGRLQRLAVTEPTGGGRMSGETVWYLWEGEPFLVRQPGALFALAPGGAVQQRYGEDGNTVVLSPAEREELARTLRASFERWNDALIRSSPAPQ